MKEDQVDVLVVGLSAILCLLAMAGIREFIFSKAPGRRLVISRGSEKSFSIYVSSIG